MLLVLADLDLLAGCLANSEVEVMKDCSCCISCSVYLCVSVTRWHGAPLPSELDGADRRGVKPRRRHEILSSFVRLRSVSLRLFALSVFLEHALLSVKERIEEDQRGALHRAMHIPNMATHTDFYISIMEPRTQTVKVPCGSNISPLINDAKMRSLLDDHCKYRTH